MHNKKECEKLAREYYDGYQELKKMSMEMAEELDAKGDKLKEYLLQCENKKHIDETGFSVEFVEPQSVAWDIAELEKKVPVYVSREIVKKKLAVNNEIMFVALMNRHGVNMDEFWQCVEIEKEVDSKKLEQLIDLGEVDKDMLDGTFEIISKKSYIKVSEEK